MGPAGVAGAAVAGLCPSLGGVPGLCRHQVGRVVGRSRVAPPPPWQMAARRGRPGGSCVSPWPPLDQVEANACADGLTRPDRNGLLLPLGRGLGLRRPQQPGLGLLGGLHRLLHWVVPTGRGGQDWGRLDVRPVTPTLWGSQGCRLRTLRRPFWWAQGSWRCLRWAGRIGPVQGARDWCGQSGQLGPRI